jgi:hypothetical protein
VLPGIAIRPPRLRQNSSGRQAQTRARFATIPVAIRIEDGIILSAKESAPAETLEP